MKKISIDAIKGGEILAKDLYLTNGTVLMSEGSVMRTGYIERLRYLRFEYIYIVDTPSTNPIDRVTEQAIQENVRDILHATIDKYSYKVDADLIEIVNVANNIMEEVLTQEEVLYNISRVRDKSESSYLHSINVSALSVYIGARMHIPGRRLKNMAIGALLHDIGLIYIPFDLTGIDIDNCEENIHKEIKKHVIYGYSAVEKEEWLPIVAKDIIVNHHERIDGSGYPFKLTAEKLSLEAKIVAICDEFDSQVYGNLMKKRKVHETMDYLISQANVKFDFKITQIFISSVAVYPLGTVVKTNEGDIGIVIRQNHSLPTRPVIKIIATEDNNPDKIGKEKDLLMSHTTFIIDTIES